VFGPAAIICGIILFCLIAVKSLAGLVIIAAMYGFFTGLFIAIPGVCFVNLTKDKSKLGSRIGMGFATFAFGVLAGGPGSGAILGANQADLHWNSVWIYGGCTLTLCGISLVILRFWLAEWKLMVKI
jgi:MFS family permease